jgi:hypothetical protein
MAGIPQIQVNPYEKYFCIALIAKTAETTRSPSVIVLKPGVTQALRSGSKTFSWI